MKPWVITFYSAEVKDEISRLPRGILVKYVRLTTLMENYGPDIGMPHTRHMKKGLIEMRLKAVEGIARVFYATIRNHEIVILHSLVKKTDKTPKRDLDTAYKRLNEVLK